MFYECDVCDRTFANASSRLRHKKIVHTNKIPTVKRQTLTVNGVAVMQNYSIHMHCGRMYGKWKDRVG